MKPIAIFRFAETEGPGYFATFLEKHSIPWVLITVDQAAAIPSDARVFSGLALMGGPMSVNDPLPWIEPVCALIRDADSHAIPVIGHCLGGQLMSRAFGGKVTKNPVKEIGWGTARVEASNLAQEWLGQSGEVTVFQWHGESFDIPPQAERLLHNQYCRNQMFSLRNHIGMQCHVEMTEAMIASWCSSWRSEVSDVSRIPPSIQTPAQMMSDAPRHLTALHQLAERLYSNWIRALKT